MALTRAAFLEQYPEFDEIDTDLVDRKLALALSSIDATVWGSKADEGHGLLAAHYLAMTPEGQTAGLRAGAGANQTSIYWGRYEDLRERVGRAYRLVLE